MAAIARPCPAAGLGNHGLHQTSRLRRQPRIPRRLLCDPIPNISCAFSCAGRRTYNPKLQSFQINANSKDDVQVAAVPSSQKLALPNWLVSALRLVLSLAFPLWKSQLEVLLKIEDEVEKVVEETAEAVEKIAEATEKAVEQVEHDLPADSPLRETILMIEHAAQEAEKDAKLAVDLVHKVDEVKEQVEELINPTLHPREHVEKDA